MHFMFLVYLVDDNSKIEWAIVDDRQRLGHGKEVDNVFFSRSELK